MSKDEPDKASLKQPSLEQNCSGENLEEDNFFDEIQKMIDENNKSLLSLRPGSMVLKSRPKPESQSEKIIKHFGDNVENGIHDESEKPELPNTEPPFEAVTLLSTELKIKRPGSGSPENPKLELENVLQARVTDDDEAFFTPPDTGNDSSDFSFDLMKELNQILAKNDNPNESLAALDHGHMSPNKISSTVPNKNSSSVWNNNDKESFFGETDRGMQIKNEVISAQKKLKQIRKTDRRYETGINPKELATANALGNNHE